MHTNKRNAIILYMNNEEIQKYIADERARGVRDEDIKKELLAKGWREEDVNSAIGTTQSQGGAPVSPMTPGTLIPAGTLVSVTWNDLTQHFAIIAGILAVPLVCYVIVMLSPQIGASSIFIAPILLIIGGVLSLFAQVALMKQMHTGWSLSVGGSYAAAKPYFWRVLIASLFMGLAFLGGLLLFIIPGIIVAFWFTFTRQVVVFEDVKVLDAMSYSRELMRNFWGPVFWRLLVMGFLVFIISIASKLPYVGVLTSLFTVSFATIYMVRLYDDLKAQKNISTGQTAGKDRGLYITLVILGVIASVLLLVLFLLAFSFLMPMFGKMSNNGAIIPLTESQGNMTQGETPATERTQGIVDSLQTARTKSRDAIRISNIQMIKLGLELYFDAHQNYPDTLSLLVDEKFIPSPMPVDPLDNVPYTYHKLTQNGSASYTLGASLENSDNTALQSDADATNTFIHSEDSQGCNGETGRYCYDLVP